MPITQLDTPTALILIDLQKGITAFPCAHPMANVLTRARALADAFRARGWPVVLVNVDAGAPGRTDAPPRQVERAPDWAELVPELDQQPGDITLTKKTWGAFASTDLEQQLRDRQVTQVVLGGVATSAGVESTARQAFEAGFNVTLALDAMTDMSAEAHANSVTGIFPRIAETGTTRDILARLPAARA